MSSYDDSAPDAQFHINANKIATNVQEIFQNISTLQRLVKQYQLNEENNEIKFQVYDTRIATQDIVTCTNDLIRHLDDCRNRHLKMQKERLVDEFTTAITSFQAIQRKTMSFEKKCLRRKSSRILPYPRRNTHEDNNEMGEVSQLQLQKQKYDLNALEEQKRTIAKLEDDIVTINEIYQKLGIMVHEQGIAVDKIHDDVNIINDEVGIGTEVICTTSRNQKKFRKRMLCMILILFIVIFIIIISIGIWKKWF